MHRTDYRRAVYWLMRLAIGSKGDPHVYPIRFPKPMTKLQRTALVAAIAAL